MYLSPRKKLFVDTASEMFGNGAIITKLGKTEAAKKAGVPFRHGLEKVLRLDIISISCLLMIQLLMLH